MGLFGPAKNATSSRPQQHQSTRAKTGGAGNMQWYNDTVADASSRSRPASATLRNGNGTGAMGMSMGGAQMQMQHRPASASRQPTQRVYEQTYQQPPQPAAYQASPSFNSALPLQSTVRQPYMSQGQPQTQRVLTNRELAALPTLEAHEESCVCTVCTCGKHACPPTPRTTRYDPSIASEARQAYQGVFAPAKRVGAPDQWKPRDVPFEGISTQKADFVRHASAPRRSGPPRSAMMDTGVGRSNAPFDDTTTQKSDYPAHPLAPRSSFGPQNQFTLGPDDRDFSTEGRNQYKPHAVQPKRNRAPEPMPPSLPFAGVSTAKADFPAYGNARPSVPKFRSGGYNPAAEDRDFNTEGRSEFGPKRLDHCPAKPVAVCSKSVHGHVLVEKVPGTERNDPPTYRRKQMV